MKEATLLTTVLLVLLGIVLLGGLYMAITGSSSSSTTTGPTIGQKFGMLFDGTLDIWGDLKSGDLWK